MTCARMGGVEYVPIVTKDCNVFLASIVRPSGKAKVRNGTVLIPMVAVAVAADDVEE
jgi:hypothetical protein